MAKKIVVLGTQYTLNWWDQYLKCGSIISNFYYLIKGSLVSHELRHNQLSISYTSSLFLPNSFSRTNEHTHRVPTNHRGFYDYHITLKQIKLIPKTFYTHGMVRMNQRLSYPGIPGWSE